MADGLTAVSQGSAAPRQFQGTFKVIPFTFTFEDDSILDGDEYSAEATVTGAALGDFVLVAPKLDCADLFFNAYVTAANTVTVQINNMTGGTLTTFASGAVFNGVVLQPTSNVYADPDG
jgi:hypothetical protein